MKRILTILFVGLLSVPAMAANLPRSAITSLTFPLYGAYTTADPLCQTGLVPTIPLKAVPTTFDLLQVPTLGRGPRAKGMRCVVMVVKNTVSFAWAAGSYTGTSTGGQPNSNCNAGGSGHASMCTDQSANMPAQITADLAGLGLTPTTDCTGGPETGVVAIFLSTYAGCKGNATVDPAACASSPLGFPNSFTAPTAANDTVNGIQIPAPPEAGAYSFNIDPDQMIGGNGGGTCTPVTAPVFSFRSI